ncbi:MAG: glycosyltransferase family 4 protein [Bacteroidota bacterium]
MSTTTLIFLSPHDPTNVLNWSGTLTSLYQALENETGAESLRKIDGGWLDSAAQQVNRILYHLGLRFDCRYSTAFAMCAGLYTSARLLFVPDGLIIAVAASNYVPYLFTRRRIIYISDATFRAAAKLYPTLKALPTWLHRQFDNNEARTLHKAEAIILPSKWAAESAELDYGVERARIFEIPFGANIPNHLIDKYYQQKSIERGDVNLLFVSADWKRKDGDKAVDICRTLLRQGVAARLAIVGDAPEHVRKLDFVDAKGFLKKTNEAQLAELCRAYREAHFLVLPTRADASPIVFSECRAFGVPPITHDVGGTSSAISHGDTGLLLPLQATPEQFAEELLTYISDPALYGALSEKCRLWYLEKAQWRNWSHLIISLAAPR